MLFDLCCARCLLLCVCDSVARVCFLGLLVVEHVTFVPGNCFTIVVCVCCVVCVCTCLFCLCVVMLFGVCCLL